MPDVAAPDPPVAAGSGYRHGLWLPPFEPLRACNATGFDMDNRAVRRPGTELVEGAT